MRGKGTGFASVVGLLLVAMAAAGGAGAEASDEDRISVEVVEASKSAGPDEAITYELRVENPANATTTVEFEVPHGSDVRGFHAVAPSPVKLAPNGTDGASTVVEMRVFTPSHNGYVNERAAITVEATPGDGASNATAEPQQVSLLATAKGFHVPGPGLAVATAALLGGAALVGRDR